MTEFKTIKDDAWFLIMRVEEKRKIKKLFDLSIEQWFNKDVYHEGHWAMEQFHLIHELLPFGYKDRIRIRSWIGDARTVGLITAQESGRLIDFCVHKLMF